MKDNDWGYGVGSSCGHGQRTAVGYGFGYVYGHGYKDGAGHGDHELLSEISIGVGCNLSLDNHFWTLSNNHGGWEKGSDFGAGNQDCTGRG